MSRRTGSIPLFYYNDAVSLPSYPDTKVSDYSELSVCPFESATHTASTRATRYVNSGLWVDTTDTPVLRVAPSADARVVGYMIQHNEPVKTTATTFSPQTADTLAKKLLDSIKTWQPTVYALLINPNPPTFTPIRLDTESLNDCVYVPRPSTNLLLLYAWVITDEEALRRLSDLALPPTYAITDFRRIRRLASTSVHRGDMIKILHPYKNS